MSCAGARAVASSLLEDGVVPFSHEVEVDFRHTHLEKVCASRWERDFCCVVGLVIVLSSQKKKRSSMELCRLKAYRMPELPNMSVG